MGGKGGAGVGDGDEVGLEMWEMWRAEREGPCAL